MTTIIWDWNGTLLNDLSFCISTINQLLVKRDLDPIDHTTYKEVFSFPVQEYYKAIGFDFEKEPFEIPAREFIDLYNNEVHTCSLHKTALQVLSYFEQLGYKQFVLSAMKQEMLEKTLKQNSIFHFFEGVYGLDNHYAISKIDRGEQLIKAFDLDIRNSWIIGDTNHDFEVAQKLGLQCVLISDGHQSKKRLNSTGVAVLEELHELLSFDFKIKEDEFKHIQP